MKRLIKMLSKMAHGLFKAVSRFPLTVACLLGAAGIIIYMIWANEEPSLFIQKLIFTFLFGGVLGVATQTACERFDFMGKRRATSFIIAATITACYHLILIPAPEINMEVAVRTFVAIFAMICAFLWLPSFKGKANFNAVCLTSFKFIFTSILYAGVIFAGSMAILATIDSLLFAVEFEVFGTVAVIIWVLFAPIFYLSLLPDFSSSDEKEREHAESASRCPKYLEVLISYILIPLLTAYTAVLAAYFLKILFTLKWPSGQLGYMVLFYSAVGLIVYVLASLIENRFAEVYRKLFPKVLIPVVIMQLISVGIRVNAYGITESRYYVTLFGIFSVTCAIILSFKPTSKNGIIALFAAGFAIFSVIPPVDAFTVSRISQTSRLESMLVAEGMLKDGVLTPKTDVPDDTKREVTNIVQYLYNRGYIENIKWLPLSFNPYSQMKDVLGFVAYYGHGRDGELTYMSAHLDMQLPLDISGYDVITDPYNNTFNKYLNIRGVAYTLQIERKSAYEKNVSVINQEGDVLISTPLFEQAKMIALTSSEQNYNLPPDKMTFSLENNGYSLKIVFQHINLTLSENEEIKYADYIFYVMFGAPK